MDALAEIRRLVAGAVGREQLIDGLLLSVVGLADAAWTTAQTVEASGGYEL